MTGIVKYKTKKAFKEAVAADPSVVYIDDPSIFNPMSGYITDVVPKDNSRIVTVTNHPKRSWFSQVKWSAKKNAYVAT